MHENWDLQAVGESWPDWHSKRLADDTDTRPFDDESEPAEPVEPPIVQLVCHKETTCDYVLTSALDP